MNRAYKTLVTIFALGCLTSCSTDKSNKTSYDTCDEPTLELVNKGISLINSNNDSALLYLQKAEELDSNCWNVNHHLVLVYASLKDFERALNVNNRLLRLEKHDPQHLMRAAIFSHHLGRKEDERKFLNKASKSYNKLSYSEYYGNTSLGKLAFELDLEICNVLMGDTTAKGRINNLIKSDSIGVYPKEVFYNLTIEKYYNFLQKGPDTIQSTVQIKKKG